MMDVRLRTCRQLLKDDGAIFMSCDDEELAHARIILDEIFAQRTLSHPSSGDPGNSLMLAQLPMSRLITNIFCVTHGT